MVKYTRQNYIDVAGILYEMPHSNSYKSVLVADFILLFSYDNGRFDKARFKEACGIIE